MCSTSRSVFLLRVAMQRHTSIFMSRMIEALTQTQFAALSKLYEVGPCSQNHLGRLIYLDAATIKGVVDRLVTRGFVSAAQRSEGPPPPRGGAYRPRPPGHRGGDQGRRRHQRRHAGAAHRRGTARRSSPAEDVELIFMLTPATSVCWPDFKAWPPRSGPSAAAA